MTRQLTAPWGRLIVELASRQHGVASLEQLRGLGLTPEQLWNRERAGWLRRIHRGVYLVAGAPLARPARWHAAVLACGERALLSHRDAAELWELVPSHSVQEGPVHVTLEGQNRRRHSGVVDHRCRSFHPDEVAERDGIPVTAPWRTILDLAASGISRRTLERAADEAERLRLCDPTQLADAARRARRRPGVRAVRRLLADHEIGSSLTRSELEERFLALCRRGRLPSPLVNVELLGLTVDFFWPPSLVVEVDGIQSHATRRAFHQDRDRDSRLVAHGYRVLRFTWRDVVRRPVVVIDRVRRSLGRGIIR